MKYELHGLLTAIIIVHPALAEGYRFHLCCSLSRSVMNLNIAGDGLTLRQPVLLPPDLSLQTGREGSWVGGRMDMRDRVT